ncbi:MAG: squalene/phytoene synthase family protein [Sphingomonas sp.]|nr:squalene/phytoene synthase family protein [Sphingomonas sp.]
MAEPDPERVLALTYVPAARRPALEALWRLDAAFASVLATGREPMVTRIRLAWWREALERLDGAPPPAEPLLEALAAHVLSAGVTGAELSAMADGWDAIVGAEAPDREALDLYATARGATLFGLSARLLGVEAEVGPAGQVWALIDLARHSARFEEAMAAMTAARARYAQVRWPAALRPLGMLAVLAARDLRDDVPGKQGGPSRLLRMIWHRLSGR